MVNPNPDKPTEAESTKVLTENACGNWDRSDPHQQEVSRILGDFKYDVMGILHMSEDGVMRSLTADRTVLSAQGFSKIPCSLRLYTAVLSKQRPNRSMRST